MKSIIIVISCLLSFQQTIAQKNSIEIGAGGYKYYNILQQMTVFPNSANIKYKRSINDHLAIYAGCTRAPITGWLLVQEHIGLAISSVGKLTNRNHYNFYDLGVQYKLYAFRRHSISARAGISLAYGEDEYLKSVVWTEPEPGESYGHPIDAESEVKKQGYFGGVGAIRYDYSFWKKRLNAGVEFGARYYTNDFPFQVNYGTHLGVNF